MIGTVVRVGLLRMWHGRTEILLTFVVPVAFFTIFAFIFDEQIGLGKSPRVDLAIVDEDSTELSREFSTALAEWETLHIYAPADHSDGLFVFSATEPARALVLGGTLPLAVVIPVGWSASLTGSGDEAVGLRLLADSSDPVATQVVTALLRQTSGRMIAERVQAQVRTFLSLSPDEFENSPISAIARPVAIEVEDVFAADKANPVVSMYAAGIAVMFLLFGAVGNSGTLLEEEESQTLDRLMCSDLSMIQLLAGKWLLMTLVGIVQVTIMFAWAQLAFGVDLVGHLAGFAVMTVVTAGAAAQLRPHPGRPVQEPRPAQRGVRHPDPLHVRPRGQHGPPLCHEREHAADRQDHLQRMGPRWLHQGLLAQSPARRPRSGAGRVDRHRHRSLRRRPAAGPPVGELMTGWNRGRRPSPGYNAPMTNISQTNRVRSACRDGFCLRVGAAGDPGTAARGSGPRRDHHDRVQKRRGHRPWSRSFSTTAVGPTPTSSSSRRFHGADQRRAGRSPSSRTVPAGPFAVSVFHDKDGDRELDSGVLGIPSEAYGFSADARSTFGPPKFDEARLELAAGETKQITIRVK